MAELRVRTIDESELETVLAEDLEFDGTIEFGEPLLVKGRLSGEVHARSDLFVAASAEIDADVVAARVSVKGTIRGDITASERIELFSGATIGGNIRTPDLIVQSGSTFTGTCRMDPVDSPAARPAKAHESDVDTEPRADKETETEEGADGERESGEE
jgi:cytoskeletal protein CcmA (bactofilin family)